MRRIAESVSYIVARKDSMARHSMIFLGTLLILRSSSGFLITLVEPSLLLVSPGARVNLSCTVDSHYEWCKFYNPSGEFCDFEWKRSENNITMQECALHNRVTFHGVYDDKQCGVSFIATDQDTGLWRCEIEEYVTWRSRGAGRIQTSQINVTVHAPTTTMAVETTTPLLLTTLSLPTSTKTTLSDMDFTTTVSKTSPISPSPIEAVKSLDGKTQSESPEAVPQIDENNSEKAGGSSSVLIPVFAVIILILVVVSGGFYYRRRKNSSTAAVIFDREVEINHDQTNMVRDSTSNITFHSNRGENKNLHEYYPPNLTYSTTTPESQA